MTNFWYDLSDLQYGPLRTSAQILTYTGFFEHCWFLFGWVFFPSCFYLAATSKAATDILLQKPEYFN